MPFYVYQCKSCGHELEAVQKVSYAPLKKCPDCGKPQLVRLMSAPVFRLKGAGWYETDFKGDKENQRNLAERPAAVAPADAKAAEAGAVQPTAAEAGKGTEPKVADAAPASAEKKDTASEKPADKPADKAADRAVAKSAARTARKPAAAKSALPGRAGSPGKSVAKRPLRKPAAKSKRSRR
jgi:putative FmdB family regulatory protein